MKVKKEAHMQLKQMRRSGFTLVEIMIVVAILGMLATIAMANFMPARKTSQKNACINNLRQIDWAKQQYALENQTASGTPTADEIKPYFGRGQEGSINTMVCPADPDSNASISTSYVINNLDTAPTCIAAGGTAANGHELR